VTGNNDSLRAAKAGMRRELQRTLGQLDAAERHGLSGRLYDLVISLPAWSACGTLLVFHSMPQEVDTGPLIDTAARDGKKVYLPRIHGGTMQFHLHGASNLEQHNYGMMEPQADAPVWTVPGGETSPPGSDGSHVADTLIVCPGLAFDRGGGRLGRGKGFYDGFLAMLGAARQTLVVVGICFERQLVDEVPTGGSDQRMDLIVTEERVLRVTTGRIESAP
jgi:5,10-methenyltetrahydrofolate synthetase